MILSTKYEEITILYIYIFFQEIDEMDPADILQRQYDQVNREKREQLSKLRTQEKRIDHLVRAMRLEEIPILEKHIAEQKIKDKKEWEKDEEERVSYKKNLSIKFIYFLWFSNSYYKNSNYKKKLQIFLSTCESCFLNKKPISTKM